MLIFFFFLPFVFLFFLFLFIIAHLLTHLAITVSYKMQILSMDGNPLDACSIAAQVALQCTRIPRTEAIPGESGLLEDFEVIGDLAESTFVQAQAVPLFVTVAKVRHLHSL